MVMDLRAKIQDIRAIERDIETLRSRIIDVEEEIKHELAEQYGLDEYEIALGLHECPDSPTGLCFYNNDDDPCWDFCLVCGGPHERK